ncbi:MAG: hypothetical protein IJF84_13230 [Thermoguttaceae bacterium]|nr:hypothetical protein [Thermoguttaceae bacterium]
MYRRNRHIRFAQEESRKREYRSRFSKNEDDVRTSNRLVIDSMKLALKSTKKILTVLETYQKDLEYAQQNHVFLTANANSKIQKKKDAVGEMRAWFTNVAYNVEQQINQARSFM